MEPANQDIIALACSKGLSFQAARAVLLKPHPAPQPGNMGGPVAGPSVPSRPARKALRVNPAPAIPFAVAAAGVRETGKDDTATPLSPSTGGVGTAPVEAAGDGTPPAIPGPRLVLTMPPPPPPPPVARPDQPGPARAAELAAMEAFLAANPVRREPDWGDLQEEYEILSGFGAFVARSTLQNGHVVYLVDGAKLRKAEFKAYARKVQAGGTRWQSKAMR